MPEDAIRRASAGEQPAFRPRHGRRVHGAKPPRAGPRRPGDVLGSVRRLHRRDAHRHPRSPARHGGPVLRRAAHRHAHRRAGQPVLHRAQLPRPAHGRAARAGGRPARARRSGLPQNHRRPGTRPRHLQPGDGQSARPDGARTRFDARRAGAGALPAQENGLARQLPGQPVGRRPRAAALRGAHHPFLPGRRRRSCRRSTRIGAATPTNVRSCWAACRSSASCRASATGCSATGAASSPAARGNASAPGNQQDARALRRATHRAGRENAVFRGRPQGRTPAGSTRLRVAQGRRHRGVPRRADPHRARRQPVHGGGAGRRQQGFVGAQRGRRADHAPIPTAPSAARSTCPPGA